MKAVADYHSFSIFPKNRQSHKSRSGSRSSRFSENYVTKNGYVKSNMYREAHEPPDNFFLWPHILNFTIKKTVSHFIFWAPRSIHLKLLHREHFFTIKELWSTDGKYYDPLMAIIIIGCYVFLLQMPAILTKVNEITRGYEKWILQKILHRFSDSKIFSTFFCRRKKYFLNVEKYFLEIWKIFLKIWKIFFEIFPFCDFHLKIFYNWFFEIFQKIFSKIWNVFFSMTKKRWDFFWITRSM